VTGVVQSGLFGGAVAGPVLYGAMVDASGYRSAWLVAAAMLTVGALSCALAGSSVRVVDDLASPTQVAPRDG
jgi:MFS family permease